MGVFDLVGVAAGVLLAPVDLVGVGVAAAWRTDLGRVAAESVTSMRKTKVAVELCIVKAVLVDGVGG